MIAPKKPQIGDIWYRVEGSYTEDGSDAFCGMELDWQQWEVVKVTPAGAWLTCITWPYKKQRFALAQHARWVSRTKSEALHGLIARKRRQIAIVEHQAATARETLELAKTALAEMKGGAV